MSLLHAEMRQANVSARDAEECVSDDAALFPCEQQAVGARGILVHGKGHVSQRFSSLIAEFDGASDPFGVTGSRQRDNNRVVR